jgi:exosortase/archaeosortase family protein
MVYNLGAVGIFQYMAWYVIFRSLATSDPTAAARWRHFLIASSLCSLVLLPTGGLIWVAATGISVCLWFFNGGDLKLRAAGTVLAALSAQELWGHIFFDLVSLPVLRAETAVVGTMLGMVRAGTVWQDNMITGPSGFGIGVYTGCSSFHNLSLAMLCWITVSKLRRQNWQPRDLVIGGMIAGTMIIMNLVRLYLMAWDIDLFHYWHDGTGAEIFAIGASLTILLISLYGSRSARLA